jgi:hypothetical protein
MSELFISLVAALLGVLLDRLAAWLKARRTNANILDHARLRRRMQVDRINRAIDKDIADENSLDALIDRL